MTNILMMVISQLKVTLTEADLTCLDGKNIAVMKSMMKLHNIQYIIIHYNSIIIQYYYNIFLMILHKTNRDYKVCLAEIRPKVTCYNFNQTYSFLQCCYYSKILAILMDIFNKIYMKLKLIVHTLIHCNICFPLGRVFLDQRPLFGRWGVPKTYPASSSEELVTRILVWTTHCQRAVIYRE